MYKIAIWILLICSTAILVFIGPAVAQQIAINNGLAYLQTTQTSDGYWGDAAEIPYNTLVNTCAVVEALADLSPTHPSMSPAIQWLRSQPTSNQDYLAQVISCLGRAGQDVSTLVVDLLTGRNFDGGWGVTTGWESDVKRTAQALQALATGGSSDNASIIGAVSYLLNAQRPDGGWGFHPNEGSNVFLTALVLQALSTQSQTLGLGQSLSQGAAFLLAHQNPDGGFGSSPSTVWESALAFIAISKTTVDATVKTAALNYLLAQQQANGSWDQDPYSTGLALQALAQIKPNLSISANEISFSPSTPQEGQAVNTTATVRNTGLEDATNVVVRFFSGDPASGGIQTGADQIIASVPAGGSTQVSVTHTFTGTGGRTIFVQIDPNNQIAETSESDNTASTRLWVATAPDLVVFSTDLIPSTYTPSPGTAFALEYTVRNLGEAEVGPFIVALYDGDPSAGGTFLTSASLSGVAAGSRAETLGVTLTSAVAHKQCV
jgi:prenyltransferase beta subunit